MVHSQLVGRNAESYFEEKLRHGGLRMDGREENRLAEPCRERVLSISTQNAVYPTARTGENSTVLAVLGLRL